METGDIDLVQQLNARLPAAVRAAQAGVVRVEGGSRSGTSGSVFRAGLVICSSAALAREGELRVAGEDGQEARAELVGRDHGIDLALLRAEAGHAPLAFVAPQKLEVGQLVFALGRPGRAIRASLRAVGLLADDVTTPQGARLSRYIESDRGFPPGFAGGPLIDLDGRALGMNTTRVLRGSDLTLPLDVLERSVEQLLAHGTIARGHLGVAAQSVRLPLALQRELGRPGGAIVLAIEAGSAADKAGLLLGDVLLGLGGAPVTSPQSLRAALFARAGADVELELLRAGARQRLTLTIGERA